MYKQKQYKHIGPTNRTSQIVIIYHFQFLNTAIRIMKYHKVKYRNYEWSDLKIMKDIKTHCYTHARARSQITQHC